MYRGGGLLWGSKLPCGVGDKLCLGFGKMCFLLIFTTTPNSPSSHTRAGPLSCFLQWKKQTCGNLKQIPELRSLCAGWKDPHSQGDQCGNRMEVSGHMLLLLFIFFPSVRCQIQDLISSKQA